VIRNGTWTDVANELGQATGLRISAMGKIPETSTSVVSSGVEAAHPSFGLQTQIFELREINSATARVALSANSDICEIHCTTVNATSKTLTVRERPHVREQVAQKLREIDDTVFPYG
jgi:hypothetical protein